MSKELKQKNNEAKQPTLISSFQKKKEEETPKQNIPSKADIIRDMYFSLMSEVKEILESSGALNQEANRSFCEFIENYFYKREVIFNNMMERANAEDKEMAALAFDFLSDENLFFAGMMEVNEFDISPAAALYFQERIYHLVYIRMAPLEKFLS